MTLVVIHLFYAEFWRELAECVRAIGTCDLVVTYQDERSVEAARRDFPNARFVLVENRGFDVWPFIHVLQGIDLSRYEVVVKLHTKRDCDVESAFNGLSLHGGAWRERLLGFCRTPEAWARTKTLLAQQDVGMVAGRGVIVSRGTLPRGRLRRSFDLARQKIEELSGRRVVGGAFVAGTMFAVKSEVFHVLRPASFVAGDFPTHQLHNVETYAHRCERMFGLAVRAAGLRIVSFDQGELAMAVENRLRMTCRSIVRFLYQRKLTANGHVLVKVFKIPVIRRRVGSRDVLNSGESPREDGKEVNFPSGSRMESCGSICGSASSHG